MKNTKATIIVILGPTATGKSDLAVQVAQQVGGEVISADSRQIYRGLDIATGKITTKEMTSIPHHMLDVVSPRNTYSVSEWKTGAERCITDIFARGHTPIICGGTGFYIQSVVDNVVLPEVSPNPELRQILADKTVGELLDILKTLAPSRVTSLVKEQGDKNPVRLIRAIEIATTLGDVPKIKKQKSQYNFIQIGLTADMETLKKRIRARVLARLKRGMIAEAKALHVKGLSYTRMRTLGLEYRHLADFLQGKISKAELVEHIYTSDVDYAKRQMTWFRRDPRIEWFDVGEDGLVERVMNWISR